MTEMGTWLRHEDTSKNNHSLVTTNTRFQQLHPALDFISSRKISSDAESKIRFSAFSSFSSASVLFF